MQLTSALHAHVRLFHHEQSCMGFGRRVPVHSAHSPVYTQKERKKERLRPSGAWGLGWEAVPSAAHGRCSTTTRFTLNYTAPAKAAAPAESGRLSCLPQSARLTFSVCDTAASTRKVNPNKKSEVLLLVLGHHLPGCGGAATSRRPSVAATVHRSPDRTACVAGASPAASWQTPVPAGSLTFPLLLSAQKLQGRAHLVT